jgi:hypothetical protein
MSLAPVTLILAAAPAVTAIVGQRIYGGDNIPQGAMMPAVCWRQQFGTPYNLLYDKAPADRQRCDIVSWAHTFNEAANLAETVRTSLESTGYAETLGGHGYDEETKRFWVAIEWSFITGRDV